MQIVLGNGAPRQPVEITPQRRHLYDNRVRPVGDRLQGPHRAGARPDQLDGGQVGGHRLVNWSRMLGGGVRSDAPEAGCVRSRVA